MALPLVKALTGALAGMVSTTVVYPLDVVVSRMQIQRRSHSKQMRTEGVATLYKGMRIAYINTVAKNFSFFTVYEMSKVALAQSLTNGTLMLVGIFSGVCTTFLITPLNVVLSKIQTDQGSKLSSWRIIRNALKQSGLLGMYRGLTPALILSIYPAIQNLVFYRLKHWYLKMRATGGSSEEDQEDKPLDWATAFLFGALSNTFTLMLTYPLISIKSRLQASKKSGSQSILSVIKDVMRNEGITGFYMGLPQQITKSVLANAILLAVKERLQGFAYLAVSGLLKKLYK